MAALRRRQHVPWNVAGDASRRLDDSDDVVRDTGWVFNNEVGGHLTLADFVRSGEQEVGAYLHYFGVDADAARRSSFVEIGSGIGRMTAEFTKRFDHVTACDLDASFLWQCQRTVAEFGEPERLSTSHVSDGRSLNLPDASADVVFSYITLQHCNREDALALTREALRVVRPGGLIMLNYRTWIPLDSVLFPAGVVVRALWRVPILGPTLARRRWSTRLGWQANRLAPSVVLQDLRTHHERLVDASLWFRTPRSRATEPDVAVRSFHGIDRSHWWLIARRAD